MCLHSNFRVEGRMEDCYGGERELEEVIPQG